MTGGRIPGSPSPVRTPAAPVPQEEEPPRQSPPRRSSPDVPAGMDLGRAPQSPGSERLQPVRQRKPAQTVDELPGSDGPSSAAVPAAPARTTQEVIDEAIKRVQTFGRMLDHMYPGQQIEGPNLFVVRASQQAMQAAQAGLDAMAGLPSVAPVRSANVDAEEFLQKKQRLAAYLFLILRDHIEDRPAVLRRGVPDGAAATLLASYRADLEKTLNEFQEALKQTRAAGEMVLKAKERRQLTAGRADDAQHWALVHQVFETCQIMGLTGARLMTYTNELSPALNDILDEQVRVVPANEQAFSRAFRVLESPKVDPEALPAAEAGMEGVRRQLEGSALHLCMAVARELENGSKAWNLALEFADAIRDFTSAAADLVEQARRSVKTEARASAPTPATGATAPADGIPASSDGGARKSRAGRRGRHRAARQQSPGGAQQTTPATAAPVPDRHSLAVDRARRALTKSSDLTAEMARRDAVKVAGSLGRDTTTLDLFRRHHVDPVYIAKTIRDSLPKWYGQPELSAARQALAALPRRGQPDPDVAELSDLLKQRLDALKSMRDRVDKQEIDDIKRYSFPKEKHLERLLEYEEIAHVSPAQMLATADDRGPKGKLFEMVITPKPLLDGSPPPALYLHLHTHALVAADRVAQLKMNAFSAVHVKTEEQKGLGAQWEAFRRELGHDDKVHRGPVGAQVLGKLFQLAQASVA